MPILGVNHRLPILHISKRMVNIYTTGKTISPFAIGCIINTSIDFNNEFRTQVETFLVDYCSMKTMKTIKSILMKKNKFVMALIMIYENNGKIPKQLYRVVSCVVYNVIDNCVCIEYLLCQSKTLSSISCNQTFKDTIFSITELLLNLLSCHGFMKKPNSTVILN